MSNLIRLSFSFVLSAISFASFSDSAAAEGSALEVISDLQQTMYTIGETTGGIDNFRKAETEAVERLRKLASTGGEDFLIKADSSGQTPLESAAFFGYSGIVEELLKSPRVKAKVNDADSKGFSPWVLANFALRQTTWLCNPTVMQDPFKWVPLYVTQTYYWESAENPYKKTRKLLEASGAKADIQGVKKLWNDTCVRQEAATRAAVEKSTDLQETVIDLGKQRLQETLEKQR